MIFRILGFSQRIGWRLALNSRRVKLKMLFSASAMQNDNTQFRNIVAQVKRVTGCPLSKAIDAVKKTSSYEEAIKMVSKELEKAGKKLLANTANLVAKKEGLVCIINRDNEVGMALLECDTDFMSATTEFRSILNKSCMIALDLVKETNKICLVPPSDVLEEPLRDETFQSNHIKTLGSKLSQVTAASRENLHLKPANVLKITPIKDENVKYVYGSYIHSTSSSTTNFGRIGSIVLLRVQNISNNRVNIIKEFADKLASHIVGCKPSAVMSNQPRTDGHLQPKNSEILLDQEFIHSQDLTVNQVLQNIEKELGVNIKIVEFNLLEVSSEWLRV